VSTLALATLLLGMTLTSQSAFAQTESTLYNFCVLTNCADGQEPLAGLLRDASGNLYGTTSSGGAYGQGAVYQLSTDGSEKVLHSFGATASDGEEPYGSLVKDNKGNLYGTTGGGGAHNGGVVFKLSLKGAETILYNFCSTGGTACTDGAGPLGGLIFDKEGALYGTTIGGGAFNLGTVFKLSPSGAETVLHSFAGGADGMTPESTLAMDAAGNLYGTTFQGGDDNFCQGYGCGTVFKVSPAGTETVVYAFCTPDSSQCTDGFEPVGSVILDKKGNLYGTTYTGGKDDFGTVFRISSTGAEKILHAFTNGGTDGAWPYAGLAMDGAGNLYGTTIEGGTSGNIGTVFEISSTGEETILHRFTGPPGDGGYPEAPLVMDSEGNLYGTTAGGGMGYGGAGGGTVFKVIP
jgi:uncharacterized repeat protein (TIGR03803 family)